MLVIKKDNPQKFKTKINGFSILEIVMVVFIVTVGLLGVVTLVVQNIQSQNADFNKLIASQLAQEGLEIIRNERDNNWLSGDGWKTGLVGNFSVDYLGNKSTISSINDSAARLKTDSNGYYQLNNGVSSGFSRAVSFNDAGDYLNVTCLVQWVDQGRINQYVAVTQLYNWK